MSGSKGLIKPLMDPWPSFLLLCKGTQFCRHRFSLLMLLKIWLRIFSQESILSRFTLLHQKPNSSTSHPRQAAMPGLCVSQWMILSKQGWEVLQPGALMCKEGQHAEGGTRALQTARMLTFPAFHRTGLASLLCV